MLVRILCLVILALEVRGLSLSLGDRRWKVFAFYTQLSNLLTALSALLVLAFGDTALTVPLRYLSSCMLVMTFFVTVCVLIPMGGDPKKLLFTGAGLYVHLLVPLLSVGTDLLAEVSVRGGAWVLLPTLATFLYGMVMLWLNYTGRFDGPYPFFRVRQQSALATVLWMAALTAAVALLSLLVLIAGR